MRASSTRLRDGIVTLAMAIGFAAASHFSCAAAVFGRDDRTALPTDRQSLKSKIGTLASTKTGAVCSAFCLAPDIIATASHCVFGASDASRPELPDLRFELDGETAAVAGRAVRNEAQNVIAGTQRLSLAPPIGAAHDWAAVKLDAPICRAGGLALTAMPRDVIGAQSAAGGVYQVAVHRDIAATGLQLATSCNLGAAADTARDVLNRDFADWRAILLHACDTGGGSSGSPMLIDRNGAPEVVALNVGTYVAARGVPSAATGASPPREPIANTAIAIPPLAHALHELESRDLLSSADEVIRVQRRLKQLAQFKGAVTGHVSAALISAVRAYERARLRTPTGLLTNDLLDDLERRPGFISTR